MPTENFYSCEISSEDIQPNSFRTIRREHDGKPYNVLMGRPQGSDKLTEVTYNYPKSDWDFSAMGSHCKSHGGTVKLEKRDRRCIYCGAKADKRIISKDGHITPVDTGCLSKAIHDMEDNGHGECYVVDMMEPLEKKTCTFTCLIKGIDKDLHYISGPIIVPDEYDLQGHTISESVIRKAAYQWFKESLAFNYMHDDTQDQIAEGVAIVGSEVLYNDVDFYGTGEILKRGTWVVTCEVPGDTELWKQIESGVITGFSLEGYGRLEEVPDETTSD